MVGHAQLPQGMAAKSQFDTLAIAVEFETRYGVIIKASATLATEEGRSFMSKLLVGRSLDDPNDALQQEIRMLYHGAAQSALTAAVKDLWRRYAAWKVAALSNGST